LKQAKSLRQKQISLWLKKTKIIFLLSVICYLLFNSFFIAPNKLAALYKCLKILEFMGLGWMIVRLKPSVQSVIHMFAVGVAYTSFLALGQFYFQRSLGSIFWFLGERTFFASTPGIAALEYGGHFLLRPYASFSHPNVLGGFLSIALVLLFNEMEQKKELSKKLLSAGIFTIGVVALILTASRSAWLAMGAGYVMSVFLYGSKTIRFLEKKKVYIPLFFYLIFSVSILAPLAFERMGVVHAESLTERINLMNAAIKSISSKYAFGVGLNNSVIQNNSFIPNANKLYVFQPVHNIFLLIAQETGVIGFLLTTGIFFAAFNKTLGKNIILFITLSQIFLLGLFDHYLFTLQQGQLLFTVFLSLAFSLPRLAKMRESL
jgi:hypothetical protein